MNVRRHFTPFLARAEAPTAAATSFAPQRGLVQIRFGLAIGVTIHAA